MWVLAGKLHDEIVKTTRLMTDKSNNQQSTVRKQSTWGLVPEKRAAFRLPLPLLGSLVVGVTLTQPIWWQFWISPGESFSFQEIIFPN